MMTTSRGLRTTVGVWVVLSAGLLGLAPDRPSGRYIGQDGHDFVGEFAKPGESDIQDMHFVLTGLPPRERIVAGTVKGVGGGEWTIDGPANSWLALVVKAPGASRADVYVEPYKVETGRVFDFAITFDDGRTAMIRVRGGRADPNLRTASAKMEARWVGQETDDRAGVSPNVGPDGLRDVRIALGKLAAKDEIRSVLVAGPGDLRWQAGPNREAYPGAELVRDHADPTRADLYFQPSRDLAGQSLKVIVTYAKGKLDATTVAAGRCDPTLKVDRPAPPSPTNLAVRATWLGQGGEGDVKVAIDGLPTSGRVASVALSDGTVGWWSDRPVPEMPGALPLTFRLKADPSKAELTFAPVRDESGATMTLRFVSTDGQSAVATFPGGPADPSLRAPSPAASSVRARPGDDLNDLANRFGTVALAAGSYPMSRPLVLNRPVTITSDGGATIVFKQGPSEPPWTAAIKVHAGRTSLDRLAIRFAGPVRWDRDVSYGPAVIGTTDSRDKATGNVLAGLRFTRLDLEGPPPSSDWEEAPKLLRLVGATDGAIEENTLKGGFVEAWGGPWRIVGNRQDGTHAHAFAQTMIALHEPHDLLVSKNRARPHDRGGKTWRWLVMTNRGDQVRVLDNVVEGVGPRDSDKVEHPNAPETILTESYRLNFEGKPSGASPDGRVIAIGKPQGEPVSVGAVVAILSGPQAGHWRRVVLPIGPDAYLLDRPVALGGGAVSIASGFVDSSFERNTVDDRGSKLAMPFVLGGNHYGTRLVGNHTLGGGEAARIIATPSESPNHWGWTHNPMFGLRLEGNTFEDARDGVRLAVEHGPLVRASRGRVYFIATVADNTFATTSLAIGWKPSGDPGELVLSESGNRQIGGRTGSEMGVHMATVNGQVIPDGRFGFSRRGGDHPQISPMDADVRK